MTVLASSLRQVLLSLPEFFISFRPQSFGGFQVRPDQPVIIGPNVLTSYRAICRRFDSKAILDGKFAKFVTPKTDSLSGYTQQNGNFCRPPKYLHGTGNRIHFVC